MCSSGANKMRILSSLFTHLIHSFSGFAQSAGGRWTMPCVVPFNHVSAAYEFNIYLQQQQRARTAGAASWAPSVRSSGCWIPLRRNLSPPPQQKKKARNGVGNTAPCTDNKMLHHLLSLVSLFFNLRFSVCLLNWIIVSWHRYCHCLTDKQADRTAAAGT